jgi:hypothetical protein
MMRLRQAHRQRFSQGATLAHAADLPPVQSHTCANDDGAAEQLSARAGGERRHRVIVDSDRDAGREFMADFIRNVIAFGGRRDASKAQAHGSDVR